MHIDALIVLDVGKGDNIHVTLSFINIIELNLRATEYGLCLLLLGYEFQSLSLFA